VEFVESKQMKEEKITESVQWSAQKLSDSNPEIQRQGLYAIVNLAEAYAGCIPMDTSEAIVQKCADLIRYSEHTTIRLMALRVVGQMEASLKKELLLIAGKDASNDIRLESQWLVSGRPDLDPKSALECLGLGGKAEHYITESPRQGFMKPIFQLNNKLLRQEKGLAAKLISVLVDNQQRLDTRMGSAFLLQAINPGQDAEVLGQLLKAMSEENEPLLRAEIIMILKHIQRPEEPTTQVLLGAMADECYLVRKNACLVLASWSEKGYSVLGHKEDIIRCLRDEIDEVAITAVQILENMKRKHPDVLSLLVDTLGNTFSSVRYAVLEAMKKNVKSLEPNLSHMITVVMLDDPWYSSRAAAFSLLYYDLELDSDKVMPLLLEGFKTKLEQEGTQAQMIALCGRLGESAEAAVPDITAVLQCATDFEEQVKIMTALGEIGPEAEPAIPVMIQAVESALEKMGWETFQGQGHVLTIMDAFDEIDVPEAEGFLSTLRAKIGSQ
jgi:hypothetical protein